MVKPTYIPDATQKGDLMELMICLMLFAASGGILDADTGAFLDMAGEADALYASADSAYRVADYETAAGLYLEHLRLNPSNGGAVYNLACCYGLMGEAELAGVYLVRAWNAGFEDIGWATGDPDFDLVRDDEAFSSVIDSLSVIAGERAEAAGESVTVYSNAPLVCRVKLPEGYDGSVPVPLVLGMHGYGGSPETFMGLWEVIGEHGCIFACPQAPMPYMAGDRIGYSWFDREDWERSATASRDYVLDCLDVLEDRFEISEVYLFGYSQGGGMTYLVGLHAPERFAAAAPFSGWLEEGVITPGEMEAASGLPIRIVHGEQDRVVEYEAALFADSVLTSLDYDVELLTFQGEHRFGREELEAFLDEFIQDR